ncbi:hypothetical protein [Pedobacter miscanthi]|jgi:hypothetical protein|uniref:hypothetical protein n=1 Tax=Pedobacter miscanthi TaxID=2259170 RepID=UPI00293199C0|nr:hypothetical protein [Pedobacter miscanthi]
MKQALIYTLKVTLTTLLVCLPVTFVIMMIYLRLLPLIASNYSVSVNLDIKDAVVFIALTFCTLLFNMKKKGGIAQATYNKRSIKINAFMASIAIFLIYLLLRGKLMTLSVDEFLITYGPSFLITFICMGVYPLKNENVQAKVI